MFPFLWYFCSWTSGAPHHSGFKFHIVAISLLWAMSIVQLFFLYRINWMFSWYCFQIYF
jgi:hypothetical protein